MHGTAALANPFSYYETLSAFGTAERTTPGTGLRRKRFVHFLEPRAMLNSLVRELIAEGRPACIENGFRHAGLGEPRGGNVSYRDVIKLPHNAMRELVQKVTSCIADPHVNLCRHSFLPRPLCLCKCALQRPVVRWAGEFLTCGKRSEVLKPEIDAHRVMHCARRRLCNLDRNIQKPIPATIAGEVRPILDLRTIGQRTGEEYTEGIACETESIAFSSQVATFERHPTEGFLAAPFQVRSFFLRPGS